MPLSIPHSWSLPLTLTLTSLVLQSSATCYFPNGDAVTNDEYTPCRSTTDYTMCCRTGGQVPDTCDGNGLCYNICDQMGSGCYNDPGTYWRESCTDRSWLSPYCLKDVCTDAAKNGNGTADDNFPVTRCARESKWCCGAMTSEDCCGHDADEQLELLSVLGVSVVSSSTSSDATTTTASTRTNATTTTDATSSSRQSTPGSDSQDNSGGLGAERKIGLGVGIGVGVPFVAAALAGGFVWWRKKHSTSTVPAGVLVPSRKSKTQKRFEKPELDGNAAVAELDGVNRARPAEMEA